MKTRILTLAWLATACRGNAPAGQLPLADTAFVPTGISASALPDPQSAGAKLVAEFCSQCHGIPSPASHGAADWESTVRRMLMHMERAQHMPGMRGMMHGRMRGMGMSDVQVPTPSERQQILTYLQDHALRAITPDRLPDANSPGGALFAQTCNRCHAMPDPERHTVAEWPDVVARMRLNMKRFQMDTISDETSRAIVAWLQTAASRR